MTKFTSIFRQHSDDLCDTPSISSSSPTLVASNQGSSDMAIEGDRLFEIHTPADGRQIDLDIVAVHGLMGNPSTTWTRGKDPNGKPWISDFLPSQLPHARVFSYGYDSNFVRSSSVAGIPEFAMNLLAWLKLRRSTESERQRPLLFICHSLGGIIVKKALIVANNRKDDEFLSAVKGVAFLGVPHHGSGVVELGKYFAYLLRSIKRNTNSDLLADLDTRSKVLSNICIDATHLICQLQIITFYETRNFPGLGRLIVDEDSARLNCPNEEAIPINADHSSICKFASGDANCELIGGSIVALATRIIGLPLPTELTIHIAMWGERDVTSTLTSKIKPDQTLEIDTTHDIDTGDPWFLVHKVTCILYSYTGQPLNLMVTHDGAGVFSIYPGRVEPVSFIAPSVDRESKSGVAGTGLEILAVIWGGMLSKHGPVDEGTMGKIYKGLRVECKNDFFGFDGYPNEHKTCQVFYRMRHDLGTVRCKVGREHSTITFDRL
ncbi:hypothetical protein BDR22DRAFT_936987 [Usnea florida]